MRRRTFLQVAGSTAIAWPIRLSAQTTAKVPLLAVLLSGTEEFLSPRLAAMREGLKAEGLIEGRHYVVEARFANGDNSRSPELARELEALRPRLFVAAGNPVLVVHKLLPDVPLIFANAAADPVALGLAQSYAKPGGMVTGNVTNAIGGEASITAKRLGFFHDLVPNVKRLGMIGVWIPQFIQGGLQSQEVEALQKASGQLGFEFERYEIKTLDDLEQVLAQALAAGVDALYISGDTVLFSNMSRVMPHIIAAAKPTFGVHPDWVRAGLLLSYNNDPADGFRRAGVYAAKIIKGAKPGDLPIEQASKFTLAINLKTAKQLGIIVPPNLLTLADELIE
jgi:putative ABC transport system substrate-binding protein